MDDRRKKKSAASDTAHRHGGDTVPASPGSSSGKGLPKDSGAGSLGTMATALMERREGLKRALESSRALDEDDRFAEESFEDAQAARIMLETIAAEGPWEDFERGPELHRNLEVLLDAVPRYEGYIDELEKVIKRLVREGKGIVRETRSFVEAASKAKARERAREVLSSPNICEVETQTEVSERCDVSSQTPVSAEVENSRPGLEAMEIAEEEETPILPPNTWERIGEMIRGEVRRAVEDILPQNCPPLPPMSSGEGVVGSWASVVKNRGTFGPRKKKRKRGGNGDVSGASFAFSSLLPPQPKGARGEARPQDEATSRHEKKGAVARVWTRVGGTWLPRCFKCLLLGHVGAGCTSAVSRGHLCYRCGSPGHTMVGCRMPLRCPVCKDMGEVEVDHALGEGRLCSSVGDVVCGGDNGREKSPAVTGKSSSRNIPGKPKPAREGVG